VSTQVADTLLAEAVSVPWLITEPGLSQILAVLTRTNVTPEAIALREADEVTRSGMELRADGTAVIPILGPIVRRADFFARVSGATDLGTFRDNLRAALDDRRVQRIMLVVNSPGGETTGISEMATYIRQADAQKPVVAFAEGTMASAAYYLAAAAREIIAAPMAVIGSIGVRMAVRTQSPSEKATTFEFVSSQSPNKALDPASETGRTAIQQLMDDLAAVFISDVAMYRGVSEETVLSDYGQGGIFAASRALEAGLIDRIETQESALAGLAASLPLAPAERAGTTRRTTASSPAIAPEEHMIHTHRAPEAGAGAGGGGSEAAPSSVAVSPEATAQIVATERTRIANLLTIARVPLAEAVSAAISDGTSVEAFAIARARSEAAADVAGAKAFTTARADAEKDLADVTPPKAQDDEKVTPAAEAARIIANAKSAGFDGLREAR
jgi:capsid assembly protease